MFKFFKKKEVEPKKIEIKDVDINSLYPKMMINSAYGLTGMSHVATVDIHGNNPVIPDKSKTPEKKEEWIWVDGYKATEKNMRCRDYQFELGKVHDMPEDEEIAECHSGFHLCLKLEDVFKYYKPGNNRKYFKVRALVRKEDYEGYGKETSDLFFMSSKKDKLASKAIVLESEVPKTELLKVIFECYPYVKGISNKYLDKILEVGPYGAVALYHTDLLVEDGYSMVFAKWLMSEYSERFERAHALGSLKDVSMDVKVLAIMTGIED